MQSEFNSEAQSFRVFKSREANWFWSHGLEPERLAEPCSLHPASLGRYNCSECFPNSFRCHSSLGRSCLSWVGCTLGGSKPTVFPGDSVIKNPLANAGDQRHGFDSWVGKTPWRRKWHPIPVFLPWKSHGQRSLAGYSPCSHKSGTRPSD